MTLHQLATRLPDLRRRIITVAMKHALAETIRFNPVDTARSRAAWVRSLEQLGGTPPAGGQGSHPSAVDDGRALGQLQRHETADTTELTAFNSVDYVPHLEYGTSRMAPFAMARRALHGARQIMVNELRNLLR